MRKGFGDGTVGFTEKPTVQLGSLCFLMENGRTRSRSQNKWRKSLVLSAAIISILFAGPPVSQPITVNIYTLFSFPFAVFLSHRICSRSLPRYLFLLSTHYTPSIFSVHINLTPHSKSLDKKKKQQPFFSVYKEHDPFAALLPRHNVK